MISRREFMQSLARLAPVLGGSGLVLSEPAALRALLDTLGGTALAWGTADELIREAPRARFWSSAPKGRVQCRLCARECLLADGQRGLCRSRMNVGGEMRSLVYGRPVSVHVDPIEKKPFYHFLPGSQAYSIGTTGCPLRCKFCQNWQTSQASPEDFHVRFTPPGTIVESVRSRKVPVIAYTYNEPLVFTEYLLDIADAARLRGIRSTMVTCGYMAPGALSEACKALDAVKVDLKGYSEGFYRDACGGELSNQVLRQEITAERGHLLRDPVVLGRVVAPEVVVAVEDHVLLLRSQRVAVRCLITQGTESRATPGQRLSWQPRTPRGSPRSRWRRSRPRVQAGSCSGRWLPPRVRPCQNARRPRPGAPQSACRGR